ncbi:MAG: molybdopterin-dependent oxidoreductase [Clostridiales Family XIII bacterium]|jgi:CO/xanthine dehydrogenase Mo-binding subunit|nr:molybdopterin-dependent oxidoreductase [Clostridiales Family XIII bacterium]
MADIGANGDRENFKVVGGQGNPPGVVSYAMATGLAKYGVDYVLPNMLHAKFLHSPYANAKVAGINDAKARALSGVVDILTWEDEDIRDLVPRCFDFLSDRPWLDNIADRSGAEVAAIVVAEDEETCEEALRLLEIEWEMLPHVTDLREGNKLGAPVVRPGEDAKPTFWNYLSAEGQPPKRGNTYTVVDIRGDVCEAFGEAENLIEYDLRLPPFATRSPNPLASVAWWEKHPYTGEEPNLYIEGSVRWRDALSLTYKMPMEKIYMEGLFMGGKYCDWSLRRCQEVTPLLAKRYGRPVRCADRREHMYDFLMNERFIQMKVAFTKDGLITAIDDYSLCDKGGRGSAPFGHVGDLSQGPYKTTKCKSVRQKMEVVDSNRGVMWLSGQHCPFNWDTITTGIYIIAEQLGKDPIDIARLNLHGPTSPDDTNPVPSFDKCVEAGKKLMDWNWHPSGAKQLEDGRMHGACFRYQMTPRHSMKERHSKLEYRDGVVHMPSRGPIIGTYAVEANAMVVAEELGIPYEDVSIDFDAVAAHCIYGGGSDGTVGPAWAMKECVQILKELLKEAAIDYAENPGKPNSSFHNVGQHFPTPGPFRGCGPEELEVADGRVFLKSEPSKGILISEVTHKNIVATHSAWPPPGVWVTGNMGEILDLMNTEYCEVAVDAETGEVEILRFGIAADVGKILRRTSLESQIDQAVFFSQGCQQFEDMFYDPKTGVLLNTNMADYKVPGMLDVPIVEKSILETRAGNGVYGANGMSHCITNTNMLIIAIHNAAGVWVEPPATPDKVLKALGKA